MSSDNMCMAVKRLAGNARLFADELGSLRALINATREKFIGLDLRRVGEVVFDFIHLNEEGDIAKIKVLKDGQQIFMAYVDYRKGTYTEQNTLWWIYNVDGELVMRKYYIEQSGISDAAFHQLIIDTFPELS